MDGQATQSPADDVRPLEADDPRAVGGYPLLGRIGAGGMGTVYLARRPDSDGRVAVKTIHPHLAADAAFRERFRDEAVLAGRVASFCTARILAHGEEEGLPYIVSEYVGGMSLQQRIGRGGPLPSAEAHGVAVSVVSALAAIHAAGLVHRDLKPANVMLTLSGCRVIDFGIARAHDGRSDDAPGARASNGTASSGTASSGTVLGTPGWMAPEVLAGESAGPAADVFTWGCLIAYAGTGRMPFGEGSPAEVARRVMRAEPDLSGLPATLLPAVRAALARRPGDRPTAPDLLLALVGQTEPPAAGTGRGRRNPAVPASRPAALQAVPSLRPADDPDEGPDTAAFTVITHVGARSTTRARLLAAAGAAAMAVLTGGLLMGLGGREGGATPASQVSPAPSAPAPAPGTTAPHPAPRSAVPGEPRRAEHVPAQQRRQPQKGKGQQGPGAGKGKNAGDSGNGKGR
ncbi:protein kinase [Actinomadura viridis]|uniref:protein kinase domain-containing protein n=1 Tax=Actinomadura viridis TaxID=58110 RepID=UPI0036CDAD76